MGWPWQTLSARRQVRDTRCLGIELHHGQAYAVLWSGDAVTDRYSPAEGEQGLAGLEQWLSRKQLQGVPAVISLDRLDYELHLVEAPPVSDDELNDALRFRIGDLISIPTDDALVQGFRMPPDAYRGRMDMVFATVVARTVIRELVSWCRHAGLILDTITIPELSLLSLVSAMVPEQAVGILRLDATDGMIYLYRDGALYLTRHLNIGAQQLKADTADTGFSLDNSQHIETLALEVQRSLDYFDSQLGMGMVGEIWVLTPDDADIQDSGFLPTLEQSINVPVRRFSAAILTGDHDQSLTASAVTALGSALSREALL